MFATDRLGRVVYWNKEAEEVSGYKSEEVLGKPYSVACRMETEGEAAIDLAGILSGRDFAGARRCYTRAGNEVAIYLFATAGRNQAGEAAGVVFVGRDVTSLWSAEAAIQASADKYRVLFEKALDAAAIADMHGQLLEANPAFVRLYGYAVPDNKGLTFVELAAPEDRSTAVRLLTNLAAGRQVARTMRMRRKDGAVFAADLLASTMTVGGERRILLVTRDVSERVRAEQARAQSELMYRTVFESANDAVFVEAVDGRILDVNRHGCELLGYTKGELLKMSVADVVPAESRVWLQRLTDAVLRDGTFRAEAVRVHKDGRHIPVEISASTMGLAGTTLVLSIARDITERKQAEQALRESEEKFRSVAEQSPNMIFINCRGRVVYANQKSADVMGYTREEFYASDFDFMKLIAPESADHTKTAYARHARGEDVEPYEYTLVTKDGRRIESIITTKLIDYEGTKAILGIVTDITERVRADRALREEKERSQTYLELAGSMLVALDVSGHVTLLNRRACQVLGVTEAEGLGRNWFETFVPERDRPQVKSVFEALVSGNLDPVEHYSNPVLTAGGEERLISWHNVLLRDEQGRPISTLSSGEDVTERKKAEQALRESEENFRSLAASIHDGVVTLDTEGRVTFVNDVTVERSGHPREWWLGRDHLDTAPPQYRERLAQAFAAALRGEAVEPYELSYVLADGRQVHIEASGAPIRRNGVIVGAVAVNRDITARKAAEQLLRESEQKYRSVVERASDGICVVQDGRLSYVNQRLAEMVGYTPEDLTNKEFLAYIDPDDRAAVADRYRRRFAGEDVPSAYSLRILRRDGGSIPFEANVGLATFAGAPAEIVLVRDITERARAEQALRESEQRYRTALEAMRDPVHVADADLRIVMVNHAFTAWLRENGLDDAVLGKTVFEAFPFLPDRVREEYRRVFDTGEPVVTEETTNIRGQTFVTETTKTPVTEHGRVVRVLTVVHDVTERKRLARVAQETADELRAVLDNSPGAIVGESEGVLVYANQRFAQLLGYDSPAEVIGRPAGEFDAPRDRELLSGYTRLREQGKDAPTSYSYQGLRRDGTAIPLEATVSTYRSLGRLHVLAFIREAAPSA